MACTASVSPICSACFLTNAKPSERQPARRSVGAYGASSLLPRRTATKTNTTTAINTNSSIIFLDYFGARSGLRLRLTTLVFYLYYKKQSLVSQSVRSSGGHCFLGFSPSDCALDVRTDRRPCNCFLSASSSAIRLSFSSSRACTVYGMVDVPT